MTKPELIAYSIKFTNIIHNHTTGKISDDDFRKQWRALADKALEDQDDKVRNKIEQEMDRRVKERGKQA